MKVHTLADLRCMRADETFRTPPWGPLLTSLVFLAICVLSAWFLVKHHAPGGFFWEAIFWAGWALVALSVPIAFFGSFVPALDPTTNWVLKAN